MPDINGRPLPTEFQQFDDNLKLTDADLVPEHKLGLTIEKSPSLLALQNADPYAKEPSIDSLLAAAHKTLNNGSMEDALLNKAKGINLQASNPADDAAAAEQSRTQNSGYRDIADAVAGGASFVPGPIGVAGRAVTSGLGAYDMAHEGPSISNVMQTGASLFDLIPALKALRGMELPYQMGTPREALSTLPVMDGEIIPSEQKLLTAGARPMPASPDPSFVRAEPATYPDSMNALKSPPAPKRVVRGLALSPGEEKGVAELDKLQEELYGSDYPSKGNGTYKEPSISPMVSTQRQSALDALAAEDEAAKRSVLFGGATSQTEGTHGEYVRPKHRYPIGSGGAPRVTPREKAVTWNP